jgi:hypothetical protein
VLWRALTFKQTSHVGRGVDLLDLHFRVNVAVIQKVDVDFLDSGNAIFERQHGNDVVQRQQTVTLDFLACTRSCPSYKGLAVAPVQCGT